MKNNVYLLECDFGEEILYKIGFTKRSVDKRVKELKTGNAFDINIKYVFRSEWGIKIETIMHRLHDSKRLNGEWFKLETDDVESFLENCQLHHENIKLLSSTNTYFMDRNY